MNLATGFGTFQGPFTITDPATGEEKVRGNFHVVLTGGGLNNHGFLFGKVMGAGRSGDDNDESSDRVFANFTSILETRSKRRKPQPSACSERASRKKPARSS